MADLERALKREGPCLVRVPVAAEDNVYPIVPPGAANVDMIGGEPANVLTGGVPVRGMFGGEPADRSGKAACAARGGN